MSAAYARPVADIEGTGIVPSKHIWANSLHTYDIRKRLSRTTDISNILIRSREYIYIHVYIGRINFRYIGLCDLDILREKRLKYLQTVETLMSYRIL